MAGGNGQRKKKKNNSKAKVKTDAKPNIESNSAYTGVKGLASLATEPLAEAKPVGVKGAEPLPFVSICTPTFNRRPFIPYMIKCFLEQDYPADRMEWIIVDDGTDKIGDLVRHIPQVKYFAYDEKMPLGKKRNIMHDKTKGDIIVYMDDDDYYPPERVSHAVDMLTKDPKALCAGSSEIYIYFKHISKMYQFGPYSPTHSTAGTFAFKRKLLRMTRYEDTAALAEEKHFLKNYTIPFVQLDPLKTILVFSHTHNTFDKRRLLEDNPNPQFTKESNKTIDMFIKDHDVRDFYVNQLEALLETYEQGRSYMKPDVIKQMVEIEKGRKVEMDKMRLQQQNMPTISFNDGNGNSQVLTMEQVVGILQQQQAQLIHLSTLLQGKDQEIKVLTELLRNSSNSINSSNA
jgi:glycosyltransferase involved in cell wall biosynthesis